MDRFLQDLYAMAGHWATTACPVVNDRLSYKMTASREYPHCVTAAENAPLPLAKAVFLDNTFTGAIYAGVKQMVMLGAGYDTFAIRQYLWYDGVQIFELNPRHINTDKLRRLEMAGELPGINTHYIRCDDKTQAAEKLALAPQFDSGKTSFVYVGDVICGDWKSLEQLLKDMFKIIPAGSSVAFCYKNENAPGGCSYAFLEKLLSQAGYHIYEHQTARQLHRQNFRNFEVLNRRRFDLPADISFCLAVKKITA